MSQITINEVSSNFTYSIGDNDYATVALPITSCWGPGFFDPESVISDEQAESLEDKVALELEDVTWEHFDANQDGMESFVSTYRGPASNYRSVDDYSYYMAITLMTAGYDVLVCRMCPGAKAQTKYIVLKGEDVTGKSLRIRAKYPGTFGNQLICNLYKPTNRKYWNLVTYVCDQSGIKTVVENIAFVFEADHATESILHVSEIESDFVDLITVGDLKDSYTFETQDGKDLKYGIALEGGTDKIREKNGIEIPFMMLRDAANLALQRFYNNRTTDSVTIADIDTYDYMAQLKKDAGITKAADAETGYSIGSQDAATIKDPMIASNIKYREWIYRYVPEVYDLLKDRLAYNPNRIISPGWDDMDMESIGGKYVPHDGDLTVVDCISPLHLKLMSVAYYSRCATSYIDVPKCMPRKDVYNDDENHQGYAQMLSLFEPENDALDTDGLLYSTHSALFAPWGQYQYIGTAKYHTAPPSFMALMIQRSMVLKQSLQYEWIMPSNRTHDVRIPASKLAYKIPKKILDVWQPSDEEGGTGVNVITDIPGMGICLWGNQTLFNNPVGTYQALRNLSTRHLVCALKDVIYKSGLTITFTYNNSQAYSTFFAGVTPLLETMVNCGALEDYYVTMNHDLDALGMVKANSVVGKVYIVPVGCIEKITVDLIALPPGTDLEIYQ